jgi:hypothetical protein
VSGNIKAIYDQSIIDEENIYVSINKFDKDFDIHIIFIVKELF